MNLFANRFYIGNDHLSFVFSPRLFRFWFVYTILYRPLFYWLPTSNINTSTVFRCQLLMMELLWMLMQDIQSYWSPASTTIIIRLDWKNSFLCVQFSDVFIKSTWNSFAVPFHILCMHNIFRVEPEGTNNERILWATMFILTMCSKMHGF